MLPRRTFIQQSASALGASLGVPAFARRALNADAYGAAPPGFVDLTRPPDGVTMQTAAGDITLAAGPNGTWDGAAVQLRTISASGALRVEVAASSAHVKRIGMRWNQRLDGVRSILGDAWERGYGDLAWRGFEPDRVMPWYAVTWDGARAHAYGVRTGAGAF